MLVFYVDGTPVPQGSKTRTATGHMREANPNLRPWRDSMVAAIRQAMNGDTAITAPVFVTVDFHYARPRSHYGTGRNAGTVRTSAPGRYHAQKPDVDKLCRALFDALTVAGAIRDDSLVAWCEAHKWWADHSYMSVTVEPIP
jgi:Holliday junction resolvase RusA-like endonuclease